MVTMEMKKSLRVLIVVSIITGGLAVFTSRDFPSLKSRFGAIYPATTITVYLAFSGGGILQTGDCNNAPYWSKIIGWGVIAPLSLSALPVAVIADTILLPLDLRRNGRY